MTNSHSENFERLCALVVKDWSPGKARCSFEELGLDSFDLVDFRVRLEEAFGVIADAEWLEFKTPQDMRAFVSGGGGTAMGAGPLQPSAPSLASPSDPDADRIRRIGMPAMCVGGLSEAWLCRELGDLHWHKLCSGLGRPSSELRDDLGRRLYATFVRLRWEGSECLRAWRENDTLSFSLALSRVGQSVVYSEGFVRGPAETIATNMLTTFAARAGEGNEGLLKTTPSDIHKSRVPVVEGRPSFARDYHAARRGELNLVVLAGVQIPLPSTVLYSHPHPINPYYEINGVNLLYFASYPSISDLAERALAQVRPEEFGLRGDWALSTATVARDVFYFSNCNLEDTVLCELNHWFYTGEDRRQIALVTTLRRSSDHERIALVVALKERVGD